LIRRRETVADLLAAEVPPVVSPERGAGNGN
jgi:hypothetical protein